MKKIFTSIMLVAVGFVAYAQQDAQFSQNFFTKLNTNPAFAGMDKAYCANLIYRDQWVNFPGNPTTFMFNGDAYLPSIGGGLGLTAWDDKLGFESTLEVKLSYSYHLILGPGVLGIGPSIGFFQKSLNGPWAPPDGMGLSTNDPLIPVGGNTSSTYDIGLGLYYATEQGLYIGLSTSHLPEQTITSSYKTYAYDVARHYYVEAGYTYNASATWDIIPDLYVESDASSTQFQLNVRAEYNKLLWLGVGYRMNDAFVALLGVNLAMKNGSNLKIGYSYDYTTSDIHSYSSGSHEIALQYCFKPKPKSKTEYHQNTRFL
ncbi:MAG TPA: type IX secretion system membrane protein PorP/SprF [Bacteroidia bacterium]|jgi:type IX secretion system PorP/SprF family membrane protein|nr:type IX secretion system membrane protein PorP/SprF [Bacteroidia bacterium]